MFLFNVHDMHLCASAVAIVKAVKAVDERACVYINMGRRGVEVVPEKAGATELSDAIAGAGFTPVLLPQGHTLPGLHRARPRIPFVGADHDFSPGELTH